MLLLSLVFFAFDLPLGEPGGDVPFGTSPFGRSFPRERGRLEDRRPPFGVEGALAGRDWLTDSNEGFSFPS